MNFKNLINFSTKKSKIFVVVIILVIVVLAITLGLYYGLKTKGGQNIKQQPASGESSTSTGQQDVLNIPIPTGKTNINAQKVIVYEPMIRKRLGLCGNGAHRIGFMGGNGNFVSKQLSNEPNFPDFKIILADNLYLKQFEDTNRIKLWYITKTAARTSYTISDGFFGRILAYEKSDIPSLYKFMVWLDFTNVPAGVLYNWNLLSGSGYYYLHIDANNMNCKLKFLDNLYISDKDDELNFACEQSSAKIVGFPIGPTNRRN